MYALSDTSQAVDHAGEREEAFKRARDKRIAKRLDELLSDDDAIFAAWACEDEVATTVDVLAAVRETAAVEREVMGLDFIDGMADACRARLRKQAEAWVDSGERIAPAEPQTELVRAARFALSTQQSVGYITPGAERRLRKALEAFAWVREVQS